MANRFWVGGTGTWNTTSTTNWSATSGGAGGASAPTSADTAIFDAASGGGTVTLGLSLTVQAFNPALYTGTINFNNNIVSVAGNALIVYNGGTAPTMTGNPRVQLTYAGGTGTRTINGGIAVTEANAVSFNVTAGSDIVSMGGNGARLMSLTFQPAFTGSFTRASSGGLYGSLTMHSGMVFTATANTLSFVPTTTQTITTGGLIVDCAVAKDSTGTLQLRDNLTMGSTRTFTLTAGTLDLTGNSGNWTLSTGLFNSSNSNVRSIAFGAGDITVTGNGTTVFTTGVATNFSYTGTPTINLTYAGGTGTRTIGFQTVNSSEAKVLNFNISAGSDIVSLFGTGGAAKNINFTGFTGTINIPSTKTIYGSWDSGNATAFTGTSLVTFAATSGTQTIRFGGLTWPTSLAFNGIGGAWACQDALTQDSARSFTITNGTVQLKNGVTSTVGAFATSDTNQKFLQSTTPGSQATLLQASGTVDASYLTIRDINATGGATWNSFIDQSNIDAGNNDGWDFGISPVIGGAEYTYQLRSFTQPRRF
jgi:hypothetical protein